MDKLTHSENHSSLAYLQFWSFSKSQCLVSFYQLFVHEIIICSCFHLQQRRFQLCSADSSSGHTLRAHYPPVDGVIRMFKQWPIPLRRSFSLFIFL